MSIPEARCPEGGTGEWYRGGGGLRLRLGYWACKGEAKGTVFVSPGRAEPIEKYYEVINDLLGRGFCVVAHDWRGQGLSARLLPERLKCHARNTDEFLDDFQRLLDAFEDRAPKPWFMIGHSMGASLNLTTLLRGETRIVGAVFSNPMLQVKTGKHSMWSVMFQADWNVKHGQATDYVPELFDDPFEHSFEHDALTHDRDRYERWREHLFACPHLGLGSPTWGWLNFALKLGESLIKDKTKALKKLKVPMTFVVSAEDALMVKAATRTFCKKISTARYAEIAGADHEILIEEDGMRNIFFEEFDELTNALLAEGAGRPDAIVKVSPKIIESDGAQEMGQGA
jgi:lysophospholipase